MGIQAFLDIIKYQMGTVPDRVLGLEAEEEGGGEVLHVLYADDVALRPLLLGRQVSWSQGSCRLPADNIPAPPLVSPPCQQAAGLDEVLGSVRSVHGRNPGLLPARRPVCLYGPPPLWGEEAYSWAW
jgi:hypothetical protein